MCLDSHLRGNDSVTRGNDKGFARDDRGLGLLRRPYGLLAMTDGVHFLAMTGAISESGSFNGIKTEIRYPLMQSKNLLAPDLSQSCTLA